MEKPERCGDCEYFSMHALRRIAGANQAWCEATNQYRFISAKACRLMLDYVEACNRCDELEDAEEERSRQQTDEQYRRHGKNWIDR